MTKTRSIIRSSLQIPRVLVKRNVLEGHYIVRSTLKKSCTGSHQLAVFFRWSDFKSELYLRQLMSQYKNYFDTNCEHGHIVGQLLWQESDGFICFHSSALTHCDTCHALCVFTEHFKNISDKLMWTACANVCFLMTHLPPAVYDKPLNWLSDVGKKELYENYSQQESH